MAAPFLLKRVIEREKHLALRLQCSGCHRLCLLQFLSGNRHSRRVIDFIADARAEAGMRRDCHKRRGHKEVCTRFRLLEARLVIEEAIRFPWAILVAKVNVRQVDGSQSERIDGRILVMVEDFFDRVINAPAPVLVEFAFKLELGAEITG